jgi:hypothetical protein
MQQLSAGSFVERHPYGLGTFNDHGFHHTKDKSVQWPHFVSQASRDEKQVSAEFGGIRFHTVLVVN